MYQQSMSVLFANSPTYTTHAWMQLTGTSRASVLTHADKSEAFSGKRSHVDPMQCLKTTARPDSSIKGVVIRLYS
jgi:hypothetical protein